MRRIPATTSQMKVPLRPTSDAARPRQYKTKRETRQRPPFFIQPDHARIRNAGVCTCLLTKTMD